MVEGWISVEEMELVAAEMNKIGSTGKILEVGAAAGRLFNFLYERFPDWEYVAVDPWKQENVKLQLDWNKGYFELDNLGEVITKQMFQSNCPFAITHECYFEDWETAEKFDVISLGLINKTISWFSTYKKSMSLLTETGVIVGRNLNNKLHTNRIDEVITNLRFIRHDSIKGSIVLTPCSIPYGSHPVDVDLSYYKEQSKLLLDSTNVKLTGSKNFNRFYKLADDKKEMFNYLNSVLGFRYDWVFEYFHSGEPAGLHTDLNSIPNIWRTDENGKPTHDSYTVVGVIIPLEWNCKQPYTVNYDRISHEPKKLLFRKGEMRYKDSNIAIDYRKEWNYDSTVLEYNPKGTEYYKEYADLHVDSVYQWKVGTMMIFDASRWHSSSWFLSSDQLPVVSTEYKRAIIGFGSVDITKHNIK